jgi:hypothetical protein
MSAKEQAHTHNARTRGPLSPALAQDDFADECPLCGAPVSYQLELTEDGPQWLGDCADCRVRMEALL